jgi:uncharacterized membrane protein SpoIIM required for sporulation
MSLDAMRELPADTIAGNERATIALKSSEFRRARELNWLELERLINTIEKRGIRTLAPDQLQQLPLLYRSTLSSLSVARAIALDRHLLLYLENLALRAFLAVYSPHAGFAETAGQFLRVQLPAAVRSARWHVLVAAIALVVGGIVGFWLTAGDEAWFATLVPSGLLDGRGPSSTRASLLEGEIFAPWHGAAVSLGIVANFLFSHNTIVGILTFSLGLVAGIPTILLLVYQGLTLGAFIALHYNRQLTIDFLGWIAIHGVTELGAVILCGAAGLVLAEKLLFPGRYTRVDSLAINGRRAAEIAVGAVLMFFVAAILEGVFRQLVASTPWRFAIGGLTLACWLSYFSGSFGKLSRLFGRKAAAAGA